MKLYHEPATPATTPTSESSVTRVVPSRYRPQVKPTLPELMLEIPEWFDLTTYVLTHSEHIFTEYAFLKYVFIDEEKDRGTLYVDLPLGEADYILKDQVWLDLIQKEVFHVDKNHAPISVPWDVDGNLIHLKISTGYKKSAREAFKSLQTETGKWLSDVEVQLSFQLVPYTDFPPKSGNHGIACKLMGAVSAMRYEEAAQDPTHPYFTGE